jgi:lysophospholipase L1-like esterase
MSQPNRRRWGRLAAGLLLVILGSARAADPDFSRWESAIAAFEKQDAEKPPPKNGIVFAGSSSIRFWNLPKSFPDLPVVNRGFGGSTIPDCTHFAARTVLRHEPRLVVFYAGDNDLALGHSPERVADDFKAFVRAVHEKLPKTRVAFIAIKPSPLRAGLMEKQRRANALVEEYCKSDERLTYVDVVPPMLNADGKPRAELFRADGLHLNEKGYELWSGIVRPVLK